MVACEGSEPTPGDGVSEVPGDAVSLDATVAATVAGEAVDGDGEGVSLTGWVDEIRTGIEPLAAQVETDPAQTRMDAVGLYVTRMERIEQAFGPRGRVVDNAALGHAVNEAEARFHDLMEILSVTPPPATADVAATVEALDSALVEVLDRGREAGAVDGP